MKPIYFVLCIFAMSILSVNAQSTKQTEEYAIVDVVESGKSKIIRTTIGTEPAVEKEWKKEKTAIAGDLSPVLAELTRLNTLGFELLNMSTSHVTTGGAGAVFSTPNFTFMMVKKLK